MEPRRNDQKYKLIENFQDFELRECIAAELAIRNQKVKELIAEINVINNRFYTLNSKDLKDLNVVSFNKIIENNIKLKKEETSLEKKFRHIYDSINDTKKLTELYFEKSNYLKNEYFVNFETINSDIETVQVNIASKFNKNLKAINFDNTLTLKSITTEENIEINKEAIPKYSRGLLEVPSEFDFSFDFTIKTYLPEKELKEQIYSLIKSIYNKKYIKTPSNIFNEDFYEFIDITYPKKIRGKKLANWFFIYDYYKYKKDYNKELTDENIFADIDGLLLDYNKESLNINHYSKSQYKSEKNKLITLIDNCGYKNLLIGITKN